VHRVGLFYADRVEQLDRQHQLCAASELEQADEARLRRATRHLVERLMDVERTELQRMQNSSATDSLVARQRDRSY